MAELDALDRITAEAYEGYVVRKDLAHKFKGAYPVPTYVGAFLLGRTCATPYDTGIHEGLQLRDRTLPDRTASAGQADSSIPNLAYTKVATKAPAVECRVGLLSTPKMWKGTS